MDTKLQDAEERFETAVLANTQSGLTLCAAQQKISKVLSDCKNPSKSKSKATAIRAALDAVEECEEATGATATQKAVALDSSVDPSKTRFRLKPA